MTNPLVRLGELGQSPWLDFITRDLITSGKLARLIENDGLQGMTSNPTIFEKAIEGSDVYDGDIRRLHSRGKSPAQIFEAIAVRDVQSACDTFRQTYEVSGGEHGLVSIEVSPTLAYDTEGTIAEAERLWKEVNRPNVMIKIPGTKEGLPAIEACLSRGLNINITLLFSVLRYKKVIHAFFNALEERIHRKEPVDHIASVASFFVSRVDSKVDPMLDQIGGLKDLRSKAGVANACEAYAAFQQSLESPAWQELAGRGAKVQRPLWASTSTKDPSLPDIYYIDALVAPATVNTMPPDTLEAYRDHGNPVVRVTQGMTTSLDTIQAVEHAGISMAKVTDELESEGVKKFAASYHAVLERIESKAQELAEAGR
ncbi:MAG: transaldolase [Gemmatimonadales bacterium]